MQKRTLGRNGSLLTVVGFGAWAIGGPWRFGWGPVDDGESIRAIQRGLDLGINWIDTAAIYGFGHSEEIVGKAIRGRRDKVFVATKCGILPDGKGGSVRSSSPASIRREVEASLKRLGVDVIDLYQIHFPEKTTPYEESWGAMLKLKEEGKVRHVGVSNYDIPKLERCATLAFPQSLQPPFSLLRRDIEKEILPYCRDNGIGVVAYSPMQAGLLSGSFDLTKTAPDDWRRNDPMFQEPRLSRHLEFVEAIRPVARELHVTVGQLAIAWVLTHPGITSAIVGARRPAQVEENARAGELVLSADTLKEIENIHSRIFRSDS